MPKRRANGEGNIRKRKDGRWEGRYTVGHDPETGKAIIKNVLGKTQAEVKEKLKKAIEENVGIDYGRAKTYTVGSWLEVWMENYAKIKLRPSTFKTSQGFLKNHIKPQIGRVPLAELTSLDLQRFYKHLLDGGRVDRIEAKKKPKGLAPKTVRNIHQMIGSAYNREGFEPPAFWSVGCLKRKSEPFRLRFGLFTAIRSADFSIVSIQPCPLQSCSGSKVGQGSLAKAL